MLLLVSAYTFCILFTSLFSQIALRAESTLKRLLEEKDKATENLYITTDGIKSFFEQVRKALEQREKALMATTRKYVDIKLTRLDVHYRMLEQHRVSILDQVTAIEQLIEGNDNVALLQQQQSISEDLEVHEQSIMTLCDMLSESQQSASLSFQTKKEITARVSTLGVLSECHTDPDTMMEIEYRRVLISEEDDPYLAVPLRFEDVETKTPQEEMRFEQNLKVEYEPENKPKAYSADVTYDKPRPISVPQLPLQHSGVSSEKPVPPARKRLTNTIGSRSSVSNTSLKEDLKMCKTPTVLSRSSSLATKHYDIPSHRIPAPDYSNYDVPKFTSLPPHFSRELTKPYTQHRSESKERHRSTSSDEYEPLDDIVRPSPAPRNLPPPIPPNHPSLLKEPKKVKPIPKPRKRSGTEAIPMTTTVQQRRKRRSHTLPAYSPGYHAIIPPIMVISNDMLSSPNSQESVYPVGICCFAGSEDTVIVTDTYNHCLRKINRNGTFIEKIGKEGRSGGQFKEPSAVTVDAKNHIYVVERDNPRVQKFSSSGKYVSKFGHKTLLGSLLNDPMGIAMSRNGCIVVSDWDKGQILFFANNGKLVNTLGKRGELFKFPAGIAFDSKGNLFVVDRGNHCVWILSANGKIIRKFAKRGSNFGELYYPYGIAVTEDNIIVSESGNNRVSLFTLTGDFLRCFGSFGSKPGLFDHPRHICVNSKGQLLVADEMNQRVQVFQL